MTTPRTLNHLSEVGPERHDWYVPDGIGGYRLDPKLEAQIDGFDADTAAAQAAHDEAMAEIQATADAKEAKIHDVLVSREVREALEKAGVRAVHVPAATALLRERMRFAVEAVDDDLSEFRVAVADAFGDVGVDFAVQTWLSTEEADAYRPAPKSTDGPLMARLRELRARMQ